MKFEILKEKMEKKMKFENFNLNEKKEMQQFFKSITGEKLMKKIKRECRYEENIFSINSSEMAYYAGKQSVFMWLKKEIEKNCLKGVDF